MCRFIYLFENKKSAENIFLIKKKNDVNLTMDKYGTNVANVANKNFILKVHSYHEDRKYYKCKARLITKFKKKI